MARFFEPFSLTKVPSVDENSVDSVAEDQGGCTSASEPTEQLRLCEFHFDLSERWAAAYLDKVDAPMYPPESLGDDVGPSKISNFIRRIGTTQQGSMTSAMIKTMSKRHLFSSSDESTNGARG